AGATETELPSLWFELIRSKLARGDAEGASKALRELAATTRGAWLARAIEAFVPGAAVDGRAAAALEELALLEGGSTERGSATTFLAAMRAQKAGDHEGAIARLRKLASADPGNLLVSTLLAELERGGNAPSKAAQVMEACAATTDDPQLSTALHLEAG